MKREDSNINRPDIACTRFNDSNLSLSYPFLIYLLLHRQFATHQLSYNPLFVFECAELLQDASVVVSCTCVCVCSCCASISVRVCQAMPLLRCTVSQHRIVTGLRELRVHLTRAWVAVELYVVIGIFLLCCKTAGGCCKV